MDAQLKAKWIEALRSGKYEQTRYSLIDEAGFCCLGVLCDVMGAQWPNRYEGQAILNGAPLRSDSGSYVADHIASPLGLTREIQSDLAHMNDGQRMTFPEIAVWIEASIPSEGLQT